MNMVRISVDMPALLRWGETVRVSTGDAGYLLHAAMRGAFGGTAPQPFVWLEEKREILGYGDAGEDDLRAALRAPGEGDRWLRSAFHLPQPCCKPFPRQWTQGTILRFRVLACPLRRFKSSLEDRPGRTREKDAFLLDCENARRENLSAPTREASYIRWLTGQLTGDHAAALRACRIRGMRLVTLVRRGAARHDGAPRRLGQRPEALFEGELAVGEPEAFAALVARGIGRHRAFGYGMLLLRAD
jgi:CRISPR system Cascade subunit CasE